MHGTPGLSVRNENKAKNCLWAVLCGFLILEIWFAPAWAQDVPTKPTNPQDLIWAVQKRDVNKVRTLLDSGVDANSHDFVDPENSALMRAAERNSAPIVALLLDRGAKVNEYDPRFHKTALMRAARTGSVEIIRLLLEHGADINAVDNRGNNAFAYSYGSLDCMRTLLQSGAHVQKSAWNDALVRAVRASDPARVQFLLGKGANANYRYNGLKCTVGMTPAQIRNYRGPKMLTMAKKNLESARDRKSDPTREQKVVRLLKQAGARE